MAQDFISISKYDGNLGTILECLRYAGIIGEMKHEYKDDEDAKGHYSFKIYVPKGMIAKEWAKMNVKRMRTFGVNAS